MRWDEIHLNIVFGLIDLTDVNITEVIFTPVYTS